LMKRIWEPVCQENESLLLDSKVCSWLPFVDNNVFQDSLKIGGSEEGVVIQIISVALLTAYLEYMLPSELV
jgi:hypothetical protein